MDVGKCVATQLKVPVVSVPTICSNEASCPAVSIIYCGRRGFRGLMNYKNSPSLVCVDSGIIANAPARTFIAGMGDAISTFYETRVCFNNPKSARNALGARITLTVFKMAELCATTLFKVEFFFFFAKNLMEYSHTFCQFV